MWIITWLLYNNTLTSILPSNIDINDVIHNKIEIIWNENQKDIKTDKKDAKIDNSFDNLDVTIVEKVINSYDFEWILSIEKNIDTNSYDLSINDINQWSFFNIKINSKDNKGFSDIILNFINKSYSDYTDNPYHEKWKEIKKVEYISLWNMLSNFPDCDKFLLDRNDNDGWMFRLKYNCSNGELKFDNYSYKDDRLPQSIDSKYLNELLWFIKINDIK